MGDEQILPRLVALNAGRAAEEKRGLVRWLRPAFPNPDGAGATQTDLGLAGIEAPAAKAGPKPAWPKGSVGQVSAVRAALAAAAGPLAAGDVARAFKGGPVAKGAELLAALEALGQARRLDGGRFAA